mgnify:CR=1 FL=1
MLLWLARILLWIPLSIMHPTYIYGRKNRPKGKVIISCNHRSNWDIVSYILHTSEKVKILAKKELFKNKLFGAILKSFGAIPIDREHNDIGAIKDCMKALKEDKKLFVFPEGTRLKDESLVMGEVKSGMTLIAIKTKTPILPMWVVQKPRLFRKSQYIIGKPFELSEFYGKKLDDETLNEANNIVREKMLELYHNQAELLGKKKKRK